MNTPTVLFDPTILFRAWDKSTNCMMDVFRLEFLNGGIKVYGTGVPIGNGWVTEANGFKHPCDAILMQYIGFKDILNIKIYEDDIAVRRWNDGSIKNIIVVKRNKSGNYNLTQQLLSAVSLSANGYTAVGFEIVGNIRTDPQLLLDLTAAQED